MKYTIGTFFLLSISYLNAGTWMQKASIGGVGRHRGTGISIYNKGYIGLGHVNGTGVDISYKDWWEYDPASNSWTQKADYPSTNHGAVSFAIDKKGYVGGGSAFGGQFYCYDPQTNLWTSIAPCPLNAQDTQGFSVNGKGYVYLFSEITEYDPTNNSWSMKANAPVSFGTWSASFAIGASGYIKSGTSFYEFKPAQNTWIQRAAFPGLMSNGSSGFSIDNKGYLTCGYSGGLSNVVDEFWSFDPGTNSWTNEGEFPGTSRRFPVAFAIGDQGYFGTGTNGVNLNDFWVYDLRNLATAELNLETTVYPNPTSDILHLIIDPSQFKSIVQPEIFIVNLTGEILFQAKLDSHHYSIKTCHFPKGKYLMLIRSKGNLLHSKPLHII